MLHFLLIVILVPLAFLMIPVWALMVAAIFDRPAPTGKKKKIVCDTYGLKPEDFNHLISRERLRETEIRFI